jgi:hypothetical protein
MAMCCISILFHSARDSRQQAGSSDSAILWMTLRALEWKPPYVYSTKGINSMSMAFAMAA